MAAVGIGPQQDGAAGTEINVTPLPTGQLQLGFSEKLPGVPNAAAASFRRR